MADPEVYQLVDQALARNLKCQHVDGHNHRHLDGLRCGLADMIPSSHHHDGAAIWKALPTSISRYVSDTNALAGIIGHKCKNLVITLLTYALMQLKIN